MANHNEILHIYMCNSKKCFDNMLNITKVGFFPKKIWFLINVFLLLYRWFLLLLYFLQYIHNESLLKNTILVCGIQSTFWNTY